MCFCNKRPEPGFRLLLKKFLEIVIALLVVCAIWVLLDFTYTKHGHYGFENIPGFHAFSV